MGFISFFWAFLWSIWDPYWGVRARFVPRLFVVCWAKSNPYESTWDLSGFCFCVIYMGSIGGRESDSPHGPFKVGPRQFHVSSMWLVCWLVGFKGSIGNWLGSNTILLGTVWSRIKSDWRIIGSTKFRLETSWGRIKSDWKIRGVK